MRKWPIQAHYPLPVSRKLLWARYAVAAVFVVLALAQLFAFEKMGVVMEGLLPGITHGGAKLIAALVVILEVAALPSLLVVALSPLARWCSRIAGPLVMIGWYGLVYCGMLTARLPNSGLLGDKITVPANFNALLLVMVIFVSVVAVHYCDVRAQS